MEDIYDRLDNFDDENIISELRTENNTLKTKLEEYEATLAKLQHDFDMLSTEYKKLEQNYSSLLKTAKAEIERKTEIIKNLNIEKDKMVLSSLQNRHHFNRSYNRQHTSQQKEKDDKTFEEKPIMKRDVEKRSLETHIKMDRTEKSSVSSKDSSPVIKADLRNKLLSLSNTIKEKVDPRTTHIYVKENIKHTKPDNDSHKMRASIRNRRKSMPAVKTELEKISSDDDANLPRSSNCKDSSREKSHRKSWHRTSETPSSLVDRHVGHNDPLTSSHRSRQDRGEINNSYRSRSKSSHRYKRHSPERHHRTNDYHDPTYFRSDYDRHKIREDSINDRHFSHRKSREPLFNEYDRIHQHCRSQETNSRLENKYAMKHKIQHGYDEEDPKRMKFDPHIKIHDDDDRFLNERELLDRKYVQQFENIPFISCESPDYNFAEALPAHQIREIKLNASTKLEDPRVFNKKYIVEKDNDKVTKLFTAESLSVKIKPIHTSAWGIEPVAVPQALLHPPLAEDVNKTNVDAEKPCSNVSLDAVSKISGSSGIGMCNESMTIIKEIEVETVCEVKKNMTETYDKKHLGSSPSKNTKVKKTTDERYYIKRSHGNSVDDQALKRISRKSSKCTKDSEILATQVSNNEIKLLRDIKEPIDNSAVNEKSEIIKPKDASKSKAKKRSKVTDVYIKKNNENKSCLIEQNLSTISTCKNIYELPFSGLLNTHDRSDIKSAQEKHALDKYQKLSNLHIENHNYIPTQSNNKTAIVTKESVADDLQLSDDTCDNTDEQKNYKLNEPNNITLSKQESGDNIQQVTVHDKPIAKNKSPNESLHETIMQASKNQNLDGGKKIKIRNKRRTKDKETKEEPERRPVENPERITRKKGKESKLQDAKSKFSDLFGESNSLITPEDLGLVSVPESSTLNPQKCVPFFEDAQDAVDITEIQASKVAVQDNKKNAEKPHSDGIDSKNKSLGNLININIQESKANNEDFKPEEPVEIIYKNLVPGVPEDQSDVVKTVIISSGVQPQITLDENKVIPVQIQTQKVHHTHEEVLKALATSTPYKISASNQDVPIELEGKLKDSIKSCNSDSGATNKIVPLDNSGSNNNTLDTQTCDDAPDVRIFVRRKRRVIKK